MRFIKFVVLSTLSLSLAACGTQGVNVANAEDTADYIKTELNISSEVEPGQEEINYEVKDVLNIGDYIDVVSNEDGGLEQINFSNVEKDDIDKIIEIMEYPETDTINGVYDRYISDTAMYGSSDYYTGFVINEGVGLYINVKPEIMKKVQGEKPFSIVFVYNEERFDDYKELTK